MRLMPLSARDFKIAFWVILTIGVGLRIYYMIAPQTLLSADEAVYGVQAFNILQGERSVFYYNQNYTGTLSAFISALLFWAFGVSSLMVKLPVLLFSIGFLVTNFYLGKLVFRSGAKGLLVLLLTAVTSPFWMNWSTRAGSGYPETMLLGNLIFILVLKIVFEKKSRRFESVGFFLMGLFAGLGYWVQPTIIYYLVPSALLILFWKPKIFLTRLFALGVLGFAVGSFPVIYFNLAHAGLNTSSIFNKPFGIKKAVTEFFTIGLPIMFGVRKPFETTDFIPYLSVVVGIVYAAAALWLVWYRFFDLLNTFTLGVMTSKRFRISAENLQPIDLILLFLLSLLLIFSVSSPFNQFIIEPRYVSALYTALPILIVFLVERLQKKFLPLAVTVFGLVLLIQTFGLTQVPPDKFVSQFDLEKIIQTLDKEGVAFVDAPAMMSYHIILETGGEIIAAATDYPQIEARYPLYRQQVNEAPLEKKGWLTPARQIPLECEDDIKNQKGVCREVIVDKDLYLYTWR